MSDNPFAEPDDNDRTVLRVPGGTRPAAPAQPSPVAPAGQPIARAAGAPAERLAGEADALPKIGRSPVAAAAAPLLDLLARIGSGAAGQPVGHGDALRERAVRALQDFEAECRAAGVSDEQLRAAHYALCAALDDTALATPWGQASQWSARSLSSTFHQDVRSGERFFDLLSGLQQEPGRYLPALEICYLCLSLGLRGRYRLDPRGGAEIERIREGLFQVLSRLNGAWERELSPQWRGVDAPHLGPSRRIPTWVAGAVALALLAFGWMFASHGANSRGDALQAGMMQLPPAVLPAIARDAAPVPPAAAGPDPAESFRRFLAPEIAEGLLTVEGDAQRVLVRINGRGMFASGRASLQPRFVTLLGRVGEALRAERGRVTVLGHSDNVPIRTVRFPSNFELSAARADAARVVLAGTTGQPERFSSVGRADTEPLAGNDTPEGRERNRRIEVVLARGQGR
jgi:type VI secretion system protein ImpK